MGHLVCSTRFLHIDLDLTYSKAPFPLKAEHQMKWI